VSLSVCCTYVRFVRKLPNHST